MRMLDGVANGNEQPKSFDSEQVIFVAILGDGDTTNQLHHEIGPAGFSRTGIKHLRNVRMVHQCQRLPLRLESSDYLLGVHSELDDLERKATLHRLPLLRDVDSTKTAFTQLFQQLVAVDDRSGALGNCILEFRRTSTVRRRLLHKAILSKVPFEQVLHAAPENRIVAT